MLDHGRIFFWRLQAEHNSICPPGAEDKPLREQQRQQNLEFSRQRPECEHAYTGIKRYRTIKYAYRNYVFNFARSNHADRSKVVEFLPGCNVKSRANRFPLHKQAYFSANPIFLGVLETDKSDFRRDFNIHVKIHVILVFRRCSTLQKTFRKIDYVKKRNCRKDDTPVKSMQVFNNNVGAILIDLHKIELQKMVWRS